MKTLLKFRFAPGMVFLALILSAALPLAAQNRGLSVKAQDGTTLTSFSGSHALVIGESRYTNGWPALPGVGGDTAAIKRLLEEQGFAVEILENKTSRDLRSGIETFFDRHGYSRDVRLLIYYAGHGHTLKLDNTRDMGYIVPTDAPLPSRDETGFKRLAIPMQQFDTWAKQIESRHVLFVFDSCFSGSIFATSRAAPGIIDYKVANPVRLFISAGGADETVPDVSVFRRQMEAALRNREADYNKDGYVSGSELGDFLQSTVVNYSNNSQHPQYGKIRDPGLDKGDFVFEVGSAAAPAAAAAPPPAIELGLVTVASGSLEVSTVTAGTLEIRGPGLSQQAELPAWGTLPIARINAGTYTLTMNYPGGKTEAKTVEVGRSAAAKAEFTYRPAAVQPPERPMPANMVYVEGGTFLMGSNNGDSDEKPVHTVTVQSFYLGKYEVTQKEWREIMGNNPSNWKGDNLPVEQVSWQEAVEYCNNGA
jgi:hypothetical protein